MATTKKSANKIEPPVSMDEENTLWEHFRELRIRLLKALVGLGVAVVASFTLTERFFIKWLAMPVGGLQNLQSIELTENLGVFMRIALLSGFILAFPFILYQLLSFVLPGLTVREKRWVLGSIPFATIMFVGGVAFAFYVMLPAAIPFLTNFLGVQTRVRLTNYVQFTTNLMFWVGVIFEMPLAIFLLAKLQLISAGMLLKQWRIAVVIIAILSAVITPTPDPVNMALLMAPLLALYFFSILLAALARPKS